MNDDKIEEEVVIEKQEEKVEETAAVNEKVEKVEVVEEKPKKKKKAKAEKKAEKKVAKKTSGGIVVTCTKIGKTEEFEMELSKSNVAVYSSYMKGRTVVKLKDVATKIVAYMSEDQFADLKEMCK